MEKIYLAPIQGFTDFVYRKAYSEVFGELEAYFIPYITSKNGEIARKYLKETIRENNLQPRVVPQVLVDGKEEMILLCEILAGMGYQEVNLNLGCPYPMVTNRFKGSGLLPFPQKIGEIIAVAVQKTGLTLSVKLRAGLESFDEIDRIVPVLNEFPVSEVIFHPRVASQLYSGAVNREKYLHIEQICNKSMVYNGDIFTQLDFEKCKQDFPNTRAWMLGRGILMNPFLPFEIKGKSIDHEKKLQLLNEFHNKIFEGYLSTMDNRGNVLDKMKQFWIYFQHCFENGKKLQKKVSKANSPEKYGEAIKLAFS